MHEPELAAHLAKTPSLDEFDAWAAGFERWGYPTLALVACGAAVAAFGPWVTYDLPDAAEWHEGRKVTRVSRQLLSWIEGRLLASDAEFLREIEQLAGEVDSMSSYVDEAGGSPETCDRRERALAGALTVLAAGQAVAWTPASVTHTGDDAEHRARLDAGPFDEMLQACKCAVRATYGDDSPGVVLATIREVMAHRRDAEPG
jgi:hypothetical protein